MAIIPRAGAGPERHEPRFCISVAWRRCGSRAKANLVIGERPGIAGSTLDFDLLLASLVRDEVLAPIVSTPFCFRVRARKRPIRSQHMLPMNPHSWLAPRGRNNQSGSGFSQKDQRLKNEGFSEKRARSIWAEINRLWQTYEASWVELQMRSAASWPRRFGGNAERSVERVTQQLELALGEHRSFDVEGEERCKKQTVSSKPLRRLLYLPQQTVTAIRSRFRQS